MADTSVDTEMASVDVEGCAPSNLRSLAEMAERKLLNDLEASLQQHARSATFACGGSVPFTKNTDSTGLESSADAVNRSVHQIYPVQIRFGENGKGIALTLPGAEASSKEFQELLSVCQPASFGRGGEDVLDEDYRKAGKLDRTAFATSFCPYEAGIVDVVAQLLLPQTAQSRHMRSIKAELYKLNVYSAPSGKFKAHVDTPRSKSQIGSLVVALPVEHTGGTLAVRHLGKEVLFNWSCSKTGTQQELEATSAEPTIKWAAFYSDCEHEVHEVTAGHRVTLTYNLYVCRGQGNLAGVAPVLDAKLLPLYGYLKNALANPGFLCRGQILGIWLNHSYAHTNRLLNFLPHSLKGADMSLYEAALALSLECEVVPMLLYEDDEDDLQLVFNRKFSAFETELGSHPDYPLDNVEAWGRHVSDRRIMWLNSKDGSDNMAEAQLAYPMYGNEGRLNCHYSRAAMFIRIPEFKDRGTATKPKKSLLKSMEHSDSEVEDESDEDN